MDDIDERLEGRRKEGKENKKKLPTVIYDNTYG